MSASRLSPEFPDSRRHPYRYRLYGLIVASELPLPELHPDDESADADVEIRVGDLPGDREEGLSLGSDGAFLRVATIATYRIRKGREIVVDRCAEAADRNVRLYLLGTAMGVLLHQRGLLPLHANAIEIDGRAIAFMGESGAGKSTLAAWLHDAGHRLVADDVCVLRLEEDGRVRVRPGLPRIRLWKDALEDSGRETGDYQLSYAGDESYQKFDVPVSLDRSVAGDLDLAAIYLLDEGKRFRMSPLEGVAAVDALFSHTYRNTVITHLGRTPLYFAAVVEVARSVPMFRLERSRNLDDMASEVPRIIEHAREVIAT